MVEHWKWGAPAYLHSLAGKLVEHVDQVSAASMARVQEHVLECERTDDAFGVDLDYLCAKTAVASLDIACFLDETT